MAKDQGELIKKVIKQVKLRTPSKMDDSKFLTKKIKEEQNKKEEPKEEKEASKEKSHGEHITEKLKEIKLKTPSKMNDPKYLEKRIKNIKEKVKEQSKVQKKTK